jgi:hypothetical protein
MGVAAGDEGLYAVEVFDVRGRRVRGVLDARLAAGTHEVAWDLKDSSGKRVAAGVYFVRMAGRAFGQTRKITVLE